MSRSHQSAGHRLHPRSSLLTPRSTEPGRQLPPRRSRRVAEAGRPTRWRRHFLQAMAQGGMRAALVQSGTHMGDVVLACLADPRFRQQVERTSAERLATAERLLVDLLLSQLSEPIEGIDKSLLSIWQQLKDEKRRAGPPVAAAKTAERKPRNRISPERAEAAARSIARSEEFRRILDRVRERLEAVEGKDFGQADSQGSSISSSRTRS